MDREGIVRRISELVAWAGVAAVGVVMLTQAVGWNGSRLVAVLQSLTPYGIPVVLTIAAVGLWQRREALAATGALVGVGAFLLSAPLVLPASQPDPADGAISIRVASVNLLYQNPTVEAAADELLAVDPDVIVFSEFTREHERSLLTHPLADRYAHQLNRDGRYAHGMAMWTKLEIAEAASPERDSRTVDATLSTPDGPVRVFAVHPPTPVFDFDAWEDELDEIGDSASAATEPTLVIGDFNASYWHPAFRDLLGLGLTDAHIAQGSGWSTSWPTDKVVPPFVRLDHALTGNGLVSTAVDDFRVPGSDHAGFVVTVTLSG